MSVVIIINPISGGVRADAARARADLARRVADAVGAPAEVCLTERAGHARDLATAAVQRGARRIVAWGGDGTINEVASAVVSRDVPLGIVPGGSGNGLARELAIPSDPERALRSALTGETRPIDVGEIDGRLFVNLAGIGFDAHVAALFNRPGNRRRGPLGYVMLAARSLMTYRPRHYRIEANGRRTTARALLVVVANGTEFGNRILIARGARVDDGLLDLVVVEERSRAATICRVPWLVTRSIHRVPVWSSRPATSVTIECDEPMTFHVDGEVVQGDTRLTARIHPGALKVCVSPTRRPAPA